ncbi:YdaS family helix-turn-helix protein [Stenotrophomonas sp. RAC2]|uniref:transcriptional regulator n=1 Tax=Stenotrophomonas sp. RAC2 TaxID=3064902 RepID=UPI002727E609|nr:YdaS family helix-turn-helix protein [Stenotrophomonas sp. RAC2]MDV9040992.1 YdaS family helix-turn-helix protein [Stenotrophomonas sp. RAC2]
MTALDKAVSAAGSQLALASLLGIKAPSVSGWYDRKRVPAERCIAIEKVTGVSRHDLRPDVFGPGAASEAQDQPQPTVVEQIRGELDCRMSKRALRARLGVANDKQLAKVLKLPVEQVEGWPEEGALPALPEIQRLLGVQEQPQAQPAPHDPDENRYAPLEVA